MKFKQMIALTLPSKGGGLAALAALLFYTGAAQAQHGHLNAGAIDSNGSGGIDAGDRLAFANGAVFVAGSGFVIQMPEAIVGNFAGRSVATSPTITALPKTNLLLGSGGNPMVPDANAAIAGSFLELSIIGATGPAGGIFEIYAPDQVTVLGGWDIDANAPLGSNLWNLTDLTVPLFAGGGTNADLAPASDPFGHVHGRRYVADGAGLYDVTFRITDKSGNHAASDPFTMRFNAIPEPSRAFLLVGTLAAWCLGRRRPGGVLQDRVKS